MARRNTIEDVKNYILNYANGECEYIEGEYINNTSPLTFKCNLCGDLFVRDFAHLKRGRTCCEKCAKIKRNNKIKFSIKEVNDYLEKEGNPCVLLSTEYVNAKTPLIFKCKCGNEFKRDFDHLKRGAYRCEECYRKSFRKYDFDKSDLEQQDNSSYDLTTVRLRNTIYSWREKYLKQYNFQCDISKVEKNLEVHHLNINFIDLLYIAINNLNLPYYKYSYEYTEKEFYLIKEELIKLHNEVEGVVLSKELHQLFHSQYGKYNNSKEQYLEFKQNQLNK